MGTTTPLTGVHVPTSTDSPNGPVQMTAMANDLERHTVMVFASASARATALAAAGISPTWGMLSYRQDAGINGFEYYNGDVASWRAYGRWRAFNTLGAATSAITFSGIPSYLRTINLQINARSDAGVLFTDVSYRIGGDAGAQYRHVVKFYQNGTWGSPVVQSGVTSARIGYINAATTATGLFGAVRLDLIGWDAPKAGALRGLSQSAYFDTGTNYILAEGSTEYAGSSAYNSITLLCGSGNFIANSEFVLTGQE